MYNLLTILYIKFDERKKIRDELQKVTEENRELSESIKYLVFYGRPNTLLRV